MSADDVKTSRNIRPLRRLAPFLQPYTSVVLAAIVALILAAASTLAMPWAVRKMIDLGFSNESAADIDRYFLLMFSVAFVLAIATACRYFFVTWLGERVVADIRNAVYRHVIGMNPTFFETNRTGEVLSRLTTDTTLIQSVIGSSVSIALRNCLLFVGGFVLLLVTSAKLTVVLLVLIPLVLVPVLGLGRRVRKLSRASQDRIGDMSAIAGEALTAAPIVQAFTNEQLEARRFAQSVTASFDTAIVRTRVRAWLTAFAILLMFTALVTVLWLGAQAVISGRMSAGELGQFLLYALLVGGSVGALSEVWGELQRAAGATERLMELLDVVPVIVGPKNPVKLPEPAEGRISFDALSFSYPSRPKEQALDDFSLIVEPGETVALVGPSGAGKSTVFQLLLRYYDPQSGAISLDGVELPDADPAAVRARIGVVPQQTVVFGTSVMDNIRYGRPDATDDEVRDAAKFAHADEFIERLPEGYDTFVGERGVRLSGGQQQRLAIARAILKHPPVMLLDEATSALDAESEKLVQDALEHLMAEQTTLVIAHRLATIKKADRIVVMEGGKIVAIGNHEELSKQDGVYRRLAELQFGAGQST